MTAQTTNCRNDDQLKRLRAENLQLQDDLADARRAEDDFSGEIARLTNEIQLLHERLELVCLSI
jgi:predicted  nucleic acid-binding Zn-ribbon protein